MKDKVATVYTQYINLADIILWVHDNGDISVFWCYHLALDSTDITVLPSWVSPFNDNTE